QQRPDRADSAGRDRRYLILPATIMSKSSLNAAEVRSMILHVADAVIAAEPELSEADRRLGDGDHGLGMQRGFTAVREKVGALDEAATVDKVLTTAGMAMITSM